MLQFSHTSKSSSLRVVTALVIGGVAPSLHGDIVPYSDLSAWTAATSAVTTIEFSEVPEGTFVTDHYASLGVLFTPGDDQTGINFDIWPSDGYGLRGGSTASGVPLPIIMEFVTPMTSIGIRFPGSMKFELYSNGIKVGESPNFFAFGDPTSFGGVISDIAFDRAVIAPVGGAVSMDTLFFGGAIPGPGGLVVLLGGVVGLGGRRRGG